MADDDGNTGPSDQSSSDDQTTRTGPTYERPGEGADEYIPDNGTLTPSAAEAMAREQEQQPTVSSGGFKLDPDAMRELRPHWQELRDIFARLRQDGRDLGDVRKPAEDYASDGQIRAVVSHQERYYEIIEQQYKYIDEYTTALEDAIKKYEEAEQAQREGVRRAGQDT